MQPYFSNAGIYAIPVPLLGMAEYLSILRLRFKLLGENHDLPSKQHLFSYAVWPLL